MAIKIDSYRIIDNINAEPPLFRENDSSGVITTRLAIKGMEIDKRFLISTYQINDDDCCLIRLFKRIYIWFRCVQIEVNGNPVLLKIGSLAKRLLLSEREIWDVSKNGNLNDFIEKRAEEIIETKKMSDSYDVGLDGKLITKIGNHITPMTLSTLDKVARLILDKKYEAQICENGKAFKVDDLTFLAKKEGKVTHIVLKTGSESLGANVSTMGTVEKVLSVANGIFVLLKTIKNNDEANVNADRLQNEITLRRYISESPGSSEGLQEPVLAIFGIDADDVLAERAYGYISKLYTEDLYNWIDRKHTLHERLGCCQQLLRAYFNMIRKDLRHLDIKPDNIFVEKLGDNSLFKIADWDGAGHNIENEDIEIRFAHTPNFISTTDYEALKEIENTEELHKIVRRWDLFSIAVVCYCVLTNDQIPSSRKQLLPFGLDERGYLDLAKPNYKGFLQKSGLSEDFITAFERTFDPDPAKRIKLPDLQFSFQQEAKCVGAIV